MRKAILLLPLAFGLAGCPGTSPQSKAATIEQAWTLADTGWLAYVRLPTSDVGTIAKGKPIEQEAFDRVEIFNAGSTGSALMCEGVSDANQATCLSVASTPPADLSQLELGATQAISALQTIVDALPKK